MIEEIQKIGDNSYLQSGINRNYNERLKDRIETDPTSLYLNEDLLTSREIFLNLLCSERNPLTFDKQKFYSLSDKIDNFLSSEGLDDIMLLLGSAGTGKSLILQIKFYEAVIG